MKQNNDGPSDAELECCRQQLNDAEIELRKKAVLAWDFEEHRPKKFEFRKFRVIDK